MKGNRSFQEAIARIRQSSGAAGNDVSAYWADPARYCFGDCFQGGGRIPVPGFHLGILMGLSAGILLVGILAVLLSFIRGDDILDKASNLPKLHAEASDEDDPMSAQVV